MIVKENNKEKTHLTKHEINKRKLILRYFYDYEFMELSKLRIKLAYRDKVILKYLLLPKSFYRTYFLSLKTPFNEEKILVSHKDKDEIKRILFEIKD